MPTFPTYRAHASSPSRVLVGARSAALVAAFGERLFICFAEDATLATLHHRQDTAEQVIAVYCEQDVDGCPTAAQLHWVCADGGALVIQRFRATWVGDEWRTWREGGLERQEPPDRRGDRRAW